MRAFIPWRCALVLIGAALVAAALRPESPVPDSDTTLARRFVHEASRLIGTTGNGGAAARLAESLLEAAAALEPTNPEILRRWIALAEARDDRETLATLWARLVKLDPSDEVAQYHLARSRIEAMQTADERLDAYARLLSPEAAALDASIRSRLAYDAALLHRQRGEGPAFQERLLQAVRLDPVNVEALALRAVDLDARGGRASQVVQAMIDLVVAAPFSVNAISDLAALLAHSGAHAPALELMEYAGLVLGQEGRTLPVDLRYQTLISVAGSVGPEEALKRGQMLVTDLQGQSVPRPTLLMQAVLADAAGLEDVKAAAVEALLADAPATETDDPAEQPQDSPEPSLEDRLERLWLRLWMDHDVERAATTFETLRGDPRLGPEALARLEGWLRLRQGDASGAIERLQPVADVDPAARIGLGLAHLALGKKREAALELARAYEDDPGSLMGVWAKARLEGVLESRWPTRGQAAEFERLMSGVVGRLRDRATRPERHATLRVDALDADVDPLQPIPIRVSIWNDSDRPVAIGGALDDRLALLVSVLDDSGAYLEPVEPVVVDLKRRFALQPGESMSVTVDLSESLVGRLLDDHAVRRLDVRVRAVVGIRFGDDGRVGATGRSLVRDAQPVTRRAFQVPINRTAETLEAALNSPEPLTAWRVLGHLGRLAAIPGGSTDRAALEALEGGTGAGLARLAERWPALDDRTRAWALLSLPPSWKANRGQEHLQVIETLAKRGEGRLTSLAWLATRVQSPDDPVVLASLRGEDELLRRAAEAARELAQGSAEPRPAEK